MKLDRRHTGELVSSLVGDGQPDLTGVCFHIDADIAVVHTNLLTGECADVFSGISGWHGHCEVAVIIIDGDNDTLSLKVS